MSSTAMVSESMANIQEATIQEAVQTILRGTRDSQPTMLWGEPGMGKTKTIQYEFERAGYKIVEVLAGQSEPTDIGGCPWPDEKTKGAFLNYITPYWAFEASDHPMVPEDKRGPQVLFFDDIVTAHTQTQAACYKLIDEGFLGQARIRDNVRFIAAGNRVDDASGVVDMPKALCNRFMHFYVRPDVDTWLKWAPKNNIHPHVVFFLRRMGENLSRFNDAKNSTNTHAWASPRTWQMASESLFCLDEAGLRSTTGSVSNVDHEYLVLQGTIGTLAHEFMAAIHDNFNIVTPEEIIKNPKTATVPDASDTDKLYATISNLEFWFNKPENWKHWEAYLIYADRIVDDFAVLLVQNFSNFIAKTGNVPEIHCEILESDLFMELNEKWEEDLCISFV